MQNQCCYDITYPSRIYRQESVLIVGRPIGWMKKLRMGGAGSAKMQIASLSPHFEPPSILSSEPLYGSIEIRPKGIIVYFGDRMRRYAWCIHRSVLSWSSDEHLVVRAEDGQVSFMRSGYFAAEDVFISRLADHLDGLNL